ncbi:MAG: D-glycero-beta-D-manno-heptose 1-phosphate adenylyltransferase [Armatimonadetes bacterium]|nr:D-glycero-beta-D-manno-heptose 1-phosphate adenylyltransferase [Armatimonadota bacterium]MDE2205569.1 D-glycero-beta-D-manno-heptose 1-phosphate adenylyltransferase [Armatimonadota bacterium]
MGRIIDSPQQLAHELIHHRRQGHTIVSTNGVFDILHIGHVRYLNAARSMGDVLVVGINSDESTRGLKGPDRPLVPEMERAEVVAALAAVDFVVVFPENAPNALLEIVRPDIHVKGGDYEVERMPETAVVRRYGGKVVAAPLEPDHSTTATIARIRASTQGSISAQHGTEEPE